MKLDTTNLLRCPFCGEMPVHSVWSDHSYHNIECKECDLVFDYNHSYEDAVGRWNRRAPVEQAKAEPSGHDGTAINVGTISESRASAESVNMAAWLRRRLHYDLIPVPPKLAEQIADALESKAEPSAVGIPITEPIGKLPPLPEPADILHWLDPDKANTPCAVFTADQTQAYARLHAAQFVRDAEHYRWLVKKFAGYDFNWMPSGPDENDGKTVVVFDVGNQFRGGRDVTAAIDAALAKREA
jgi:Lar family restriction alleviation protein